MGAYNFSQSMRFDSFRNGVFVCLAGLVLASAPALAQSGGAKPAEPQKVENPTRDSQAKDTQRKVDEIAEAGRALTGPAANPECVWLGRRVVGLMWRDDLDTAFRHLDLYDRFGCPGGHVQATFRCLVRQGNIDPKVPESLNGRVHTCWINPSLQPTAAAAADAPAAKPNTDGTAPK